MRALFHRRAARRGRKRALVAVAHAILVIAGHVLPRRTPYQELGGDSLDRLQAEGLKRSLVRRLERLGHTVVLQPQAAR